MINFRRLMFLRPAFLATQSVLKRLGIQLTYTRVSGIPDADLYSPLFEPWRSESWRSTLRDDDQRTLVPLQARYLLYMLAEDATRRCQGDLAECGVYKGGTAHLLASLARSAGRTISLFDTFAGMPQTDPDKDLHREGDFADTSLDSVRAYLGEFQNAEFFPGHIPATLNAVSSRTFCFVHIDLDIYNAIIAATSFFYERLPKDGVLLYDDYGYPSCPGARQAVDEFFSTKPETPQVMGTGQCVVRKL
jgi:O-methyltransferase